MDNSLLILENFMIVGKRGKSTPILFPKPTFSSPCRPERGHKGFFWGGKDVRHPQVTLTAMRLIQPKGVFRTVGSKSLSPSALARLQERTPRPPQTIQHLKIKADTASPQTIQTFCTPTIKRNLFFPKTHILLPPAAPKEAFRASFGAARMCATLKSP